MPAPTTQPTPDDLAHYRDVLNDLIDMGHQLAKHVHAQAMATPAPAPDPTIPFDRIARAIRRTINLARRLDEPLSPAQPDPRTAARKRILREVEDAIQRTPRPDADRLQTELLERLDSEDLEDDIALLPIPAIIADICRDLGLESMPSLGIHPWKRRTPEDLRSLCARAAQPPGGKIVTLRPRNPATKPAPHPPDH